jgi:hypothetical protein
MKHIDLSRGRRTIFKKCPNCGFEWISRDYLLRDPNIEIIGYQVHFEELTAGIFLFNHSCRTTLGILAGDFKDLYKGPILGVRATGSKECPSYCMHQNELRPCPAECECAYVREIIQIIKNWPKG